MPLGCLLDSTRCSGQIVPCKGVLLTSSDNRSMSAANCVLWPAGGYNYTVGTTHGFFRPDLLWPIAMGAMYISSLLILLYVIQQRLQVVALLTLPCFVLPVAK